VKQRLVFFAIGLSIIFPVSAQAQSARTSCGILGPVPGMTVGAISTNKQKPVVSSAQAIAAVVEPPHITPLAWIIWDEAATPWLMVKDYTPRAIGAIAGGSLPTNRGRYVSGTYGIARREVVVPPGFQLLACPFIER